jgi:hypothetical protein
MHSDTECSIIDQDALPEYFPTHRHAASFWETRERTAANFAKAIFAFTGTRDVSPQEVEAEFEKWLSTLQKALTDPLGDLIDTYGKAAPPSQNDNYRPQDLLDDLRKAAELCNVLCHGSWPHS